MAGNQDREKDAGPVTVEAKIIRALEGFGDPIENGVHTSTKDRYYVFYVSRFGTHYADDEPQFQVASVQIHFFAPLDENISRYIRDTKMALKDAGFLWPRTVDASDKDARHIVFETEIEDLV